MPDTFEIHPHMLGGYADCSLRSIVNAAPELFKSRGFTPRQVPTTAGAAVGTGVHAGIAWMSKQKLAGYNYTMTDGIEYGVTEFRKEIEEEWQTDEVTPSKPDGENQVQQLTRAYWGTDGYASDPLLVEHQYKAGLSEILGFGGYEMVGTLDRIDRCAGRGTALIDVKTGKRNSIHPLQLASYLLLALTHGWLADWVGHVFLKRVKRGQPVEHPKWVPYSADVIIKVLPPMLKRVARDVEAFKATGNPAVFNTNPGSNFCSSRYCDAYGSDICEMWKLKEAINQS